MKLKINSATLLLSIAIFSIGLFSCKKDPEVIIETETITITDTVTVTNTETITDTATTFILIRHAETTGGSANPSLSTNGQNRANELITVLGNISLQAVFSTNYNRTTQTATPVATDQSLTVQNYNPSTLEAFADTNIPIHKGETILVVGHSNTTPDLINILVGSNLYSNIPETEYDNLFIVSVYQKGNASVLHMKYGQ